MDLAKRYWESRILRWERARYFGWGAVNPLSWTVRRRMKLALEIYYALEPAPASVFELGCGGSGLFANGLRPDCKRYCGVDIAGAAVRAARAGVSDPRAEFREGDAVQALHSSADFDLCVFLGLTDWLDPAELREFFRRARSRWLLFSHTEPGNSIYNFYRTRKDGAEYAARSYSRAEIAEASGPAGYAEVAARKTYPFDPGRIVLMERR